MKSSIQARRASSGALGLVVNQKAEQIGLNGIELGLSAACFDVASVDLLRRRRRLYRLFLSITG
jgi:hypothetical protein